MSEYVTQPGTYKGYIKAYELRKAQSGSKGIHITVQIEETFVDNEWHDWREYDFEAEGTFWVVKKDGTLNSYAVDPMMEYAGWDGDFTAIVQKTWEPKPVNITVKEEVYNDAVTLRIDYLNEYDRGGSCARWRAIVCETRNRRKTLLSDRRRKKPLKKLKSLLRNLLLSPPQ